MENQTEYGDWADEVEGLLSERFPDDDYSDDLFLSLFEDGMSPEEAMAHYGQRR